jgi:hypothetical protein
MALGQLGVIRPARWPFCDTGGVIADLKRRAAHEKLK